MSKITSVMLIAAMAAASPMAGVATVAAAEGEVDGSASQGLEELSLEELLDVVIVSAAKTEQRVTESPSIITVIDAKELRDRGYRTVAEALTQVPGLAVIDAHSAHYVGIRGTYGGAESPNDVLKVMINGQSTLFRPTATHFLGHDLLPIEAVKRIEVIRGPASALYGANAFLGVVNIVTFDGTEEEGAGHRLVGDGYTLGTGDRPTLNGSLSAVSAAKLGDFHFLLSGTFHRDDRSGLEVPIDLERQSPSPAWDVSTRRYLADEGKTDNDVGRSGSAYGLLGYSFTPKLKAEVDGHLQYNDVAAEFAEYSTLTHETHLAHVNGYGRAQVHYNAQGEPGIGAALSVTLASGRPLAAERIRDSSIDSSYKRRRMGYSALDMTAELRWSYDKMNQVLIGADYSRDEETLLSVEMLDSAGERLALEAGPGRRRFDNLGAYLQLMLSPLDDLSFTFGARGDHNSATACAASVWSCFGGLDDEVVSTPDVSGLQRDVIVSDRGYVQISSRAAAVYQLPFLDSYAKVLYGSSFKPPSPYQLHHGSLAVYGASVGNPALKPQTATTVEVAYGLRPISSLHAEIVGYYTVVEDFVVSTKEGGVVVARNADLTLGGGEVSVDYVISREIRAYANATVVAYSRLEPLRRVDETEADWQYSPLNEQLQAGSFPDCTVGLGLDYRLQEWPLQVSGNLLYVGERRASLINSQLADPLDLSSAYTLPPRLSVSVNLATVGWRPLAAIADETTVSLALRGIIGEPSQPGFGGVDIPEPRAQALLRLEQRW